VPYDGIPGVDSNKDPIPSFGAQNKGCEVPKWAPISRVSMHILESIILAEWYIFHQAAEIYRHSLSKMSIGQIRSVAVFVAARDIPVHEELLPTNRALGNNETVPRVSNLDDDEVKTTQEYGRKMLKANRRDSLIFNFLGQSTR
jgi:hypothetical protein